MKFTNKAELPEAICNAIANDEYSKGDAKYSVSNLIQPVQAYHIIKRHAGEISVDYSDEIWKLLGSAVHYILEKGAAPEDGAYVVTEERMYMRIGGIVLSGKPDYMTMLARRIEDYKVTSVWKILKGDFYDWECQLNVYRLIADHNGRAIDSLKVNAVLKDWKKYEAGRDPNYPSIPVAQVMIPVWSLLDTTSFVLERVRILEAAEKLTEQELSEKFPCSDKERWHQPDKFACIKPGGKRASATFDTHDEAFAYLQDHPDCVLEVRAGEDTRCLEFCLAKTWCRQFNKREVVFGNLDNPHDEGKLNDLVNELVPAIKNEPINPVDREPIIGSFMKEFLTTAEPIRDEGKTDLSTILPASQEITQGMEENTHVNQEVVDTILPEPEKDFGAKMQAQREQAWAAIEAQKQISPTEEPKLESIDNKVDLDIENLFKDLGI